MDTRKALPTFVVFLILGAIIAVIVVTVQSGEEGKEKETSPVPTNEGPPGVDAKAIAFPTFVLDGPALEAELEKATASRIEAVQADPTTAGLLRHFEYIGMLENIRYSAFEIEAARRRFTALASQTIATHGPGGYMAAGEIAYQRFLVVLRRHLEIQQNPGPEAYGIAPSSASVVSGLGAAAAMLGSIRELEYLRGFLQLAQDEGLIAEGGALTEQGEAVIHLLFRYQWAQQAREAQPPERLMSPLAYRAVRRWQIEGSSLDPLRKELMLEKVGQALEGYPVDWAMGILKYQQGEMLQARDAFLRALEQAGTDEHKQELRGFLATLGAMEQGT